MSPLQSPLMAVLLAGCQALRHPLPVVDALSLPKKIHVTSKAFVQGGKIPLANSNYGAGISPDLSWTGVPAAAQSLVLLVQDPDTAQGLYTHWILYNISPKTQTLPAGLPPRRGTLKEGLQGENDSGLLGYFGPMPPDDKPHHYHFQIIALNSRMRPRPGYDTSTILASIHDHAIAGGDLVGLFKKP